MMIDQFIIEAKQQLATADIVSAKLDAELILAHVLDKPREYIFAHGNEALSSDNQNSADELIKKRAKHHPLVHLTGQREFYGLDFEITPDVLTPRVETERMVALAIEKTTQNGSLLDVGTGSGAIGIAIAHHRPDLATSLADVSAAALGVARRNAKRYGIAATFIESDLMDQISGQFDVVTANLPYLRNDADLMAEVRREPRIALVGGDDGLDLYRQFFKQIQPHLKPAAVVLIEADPWQHPELCQFASAAGLKLLVDDYFIILFKGPETIQPPALELP